MVPLSIYALNYYKTNVETVGDASCRNIGALEKTRAYYDTTRRALHGLYQDLVQMKRNLPFFTYPDQLGVFTLSSDLLSWGQFGAFNLGSLISASSEAALSVVEQEKLMRLRDLELEKLQQGIYDIHLFLAFHISELINNRNQFNDALEELIANINSNYVNVWNHNKDRLWKELVLGFYNALFFQEELLISVERSIFELDSVCSYYSRLNNFFVNQTTNLNLVIPEQIGSNELFRSELVRIQKIFNWNRGTVVEYLRKNHYLSEVLTRGLQERANGHWLAFGQKIGRQARDKFNGIKELGKEASSSAEDSTKSFAKNYIFLSQERDALASKYNNIREYLGKKLYFDFEHIFEGETYRNGGLGGFHHDYLGYAQRMGIKMVKDIKYYSHGFYEAYVLDGNGKWVPKSFFPNSWSREKVVEKIIEVFDSAIKGVQQVAFTEATPRVVLNGFLSEGIEVKIVIDKTGKIITAYPYLSN